MPPQPRSQMFPHIGMMKCGTYYLIGLNVVFGILGIVVILYGIGMVILSEKFDALFKRSTGTALASEMIVSGIFLLIIAYFGCYAVIYEHRCMILTYSGVMSFIVLLRLVTIVMSLGSTSKKEETEMKQNLNDSMKEYDSNEKIQIAWDAFQESWKCCGVDNYTDWGENIPKSCCKEKLEKDEKCPTGKNFKKGCWETLYEVFDDSTKGMGIWNIVAFLLEISAVVFACLFARAIKIKQIAPQQESVAGEQQENQQHSQQGESMHSGISSV